MRLRWTALPFLQQSVLGDLFYTALVFGALRIADLRMPRVRAAG